MKPVSSSHDLPTECMSCFTVGLTSVELLTRASLSCVSLLSSLFPSLCGSFFWGAVPIELEPLLVNASSSHRRNSRVCSAQSPGSASWILEKSPRACVLLSQASGIQERIPVFGLLVITVFVFYHLKAMPKKINKENKQTKKKHNKVVRCLTTRAIKIFLSYPKL